MATIMLLDVLSIFCGTLMSVALLPGVAWCSSHRGDVSCYRRSYS